MLEQERISRIMEDRVQYIIVPEVRHAEGLAAYVSYDVAAYDSFRGEIVERVADVTCDRELALSIVERFNRYRLSPVHLKEAVLNELP